MSFLRVCTCEYIDIIRLHVFMYYVPRLLPYIYKFDNKNCHQLKRKRSYILRRKWKRKNGNNNYY